MRERIFDRFDRLGAEDSSVGGSGVGLNYARNLASVHKGELTFRPNAGKGSVFTLLIPVSRSSFDPQDILDEKYTPETNASRPEGSSPSDDSLDKEGTLMVVEDNAEIREFIMSIFRDRFRVVNAADGKEALDSLKISIPDIVISDVLMPNMNGYELCRTVKEDPDLGGIPIILLTAKSDAASSVEGLKSGADAYIAKPFDPDVLSATVSNLIGNRQYLQKMVLNLTSNTINEPKISEAAGLNRKDKALLESIYSVMDSNLDSDSFTIEDMASEMNISYSSLYAKIKALTGKSPIQFMTAYRMNRAMELLRSGKYTVGEVGYKVGAPSLSTFSRDFKKHYGYSPSSVLKSE